ncbi:MAG: hypothetical protein F4X42_01060 [Rhodospirillaceae bacterium]|nr:hypothetical protein [Rhodospirillaceae bacterium]MYB11836.1 hypothetical protein [Rhodospirillaceae bacterium]
MAENRRKPPAGRLPGSGSLKEKMEIRNTFFILFMLRGIFSCVGREPAGTANAARSSAKPDNAARTPIPA